MGWETRSIAAFIVAASLALSRAPLFAQPMPANVPPAAILADEKERDSREKLGEIVAALGVGPWSAVADIGTGYGYYAVRIARVVGASGRVYAQEIDERLVKKLGRRVQAEKLTNVEPVLGKPDAPGLPLAALDAVLLADVYHEVDNPSALLRGIRLALKPQGRLVVIEYMKPELRPKTRERQRKDHNIAPEFVERDLREAGFEVTGRHDPLGPG